MTRSRLLPPTSSPSGTQPRAALALARSMSFVFGIGLATLAAGPAGASQLEGGTIGAPMHGTSADPQPPRDRGDAGSARQRAADAASPADRRAGSRAPAAPASGPRAGR